MKELNVLGVALKFELIIPQQEGRCKVVPIVVEHGRGDHRLIVHFSLPIPGNFQLIGCKINNNFLSCTDIDPLNCKEI
jgi:hypothetical protein